MSSETIAYIVFGSLGALFVLGASVLAVMYAIKLDKEKLTVDGDTLAIGHSARVEGSFEVQGSTKLDADLAVTGAAGFGADLEVAGAAKVGAGLEVVGDTAIGASLVVTGAAEFKDGLDVSGSTTSINGFVQLVPSDAAAYNLLMVSSDLSKITTTPQSNVAAAYFVDGVGGNDTNDGMSSGTAFLTVGRAITVLRANPTWRGEATLTFVDTYTATATEVWDFSSTGLGDGSDRTVRLQGGPAFFAGPQVLPSVTTVADLTAPQQMSRYVETGTLPLTTTSGFLGNTGEPTVPFIVFNSGTPQTLTFADDATGATVTAAEPLELGSAAKFVTVGTTLTIIIDVSTALVCSDIAFQVGAGALGKVNVTSQAAVSVSMDHVQFDTDSSANTNTMALDLTTLGSGSQVSISNSLFRSTQATANSQNATQLLAGPSAVDVAVSSCMFTNGSTSVTGNAQLREIYCGRLVAAATCSGPGSQLLLQLENSLNTAYVLNRGAEAGANECNFNIDTSTIFSCSNGSQLSTDNCTGLVGTGGFVSLTGASWAQLNRHTLNNPVANPAVLSASIDKMSTLAVTESLVVTTSDISNQYSIVLGATAAQPFAQTAVVFQEDATTGARFSAL